MGPEIDPPSCWRRSGRLEDGQRIARGEVLVAIVVEAVGVQAIGAGAQHHVDAAAGGASEFGLVGALSDLKFLHGVGADRAGRAIASAILGEVGLVVVVALDHVVVEVAGRAAKAEQPEAAVARHARE